MSQKFKELKSEEHSFIEYYIAILSQRELIWVETQWHNRILNPVRDSVPEGIDMGRKATPPSNIFIPLGMLSRRELIWVEK